MTYEWAFLPMQSSNDLLGDRAQLGERLAEDGYLYFEELMPRDAVLDVRRDMLTTLAEVGWIRGGDVLLDALAIADPVREGEEEFLRAMREVQKLESFHTLAHCPQLVEVMRDVVGDTAFAHPLKIARLIFPEFEATSTPPHQDFPNNQGTTNLTATWIPIGDVPFEAGGLAVLRGSHKWGCLPLASHLGAGNRCALLPLDMLEQCRWVTTEFTMGDVLLFPSLTVHAARHNLSTSSMRISVDFRWQQQGEALTKGCLEPHFSQLSWDEIYEDWTSEEHQYYWRDLDFQITPFEDLPVEHPKGEFELLGDYIRQTYRSSKRRSLRETH